MTELAEAVRALRKALASPVVSIGLVLWLVGLGGFVAIGLGWRGAAATPYVPFQVPYLVSGGFVGLALLVFALGMFDVHVNRVQSAHRRALTTEALQDAVSLLERANERRRASR